MTTTTHVLMTGISFGESPRWHDGRLWFADWGTQELIAVDTAGASEVVSIGDGFLPFCIDWLPDGRLVIAAAGEQAVLRQEPDASLVRHADLSGLSEHAWNEIAVDGRGNAYVNNIGFDLAGGEFAPGIVAVVAPDGSARQVADGFAFPNGMAITPDGSTLIVAESYGGGSRPSTSRPAAGCRTGAPGRTSARERLRTASASTPRAPSGTATSRTATAGAWPRAARCSKWSSSTAAASPARWVATTAGRCSWSPASGRGWRASVVTS